MGGERGEMGGGGRERIPGSKLNINAKKSYFWKPTCVFYGVKNILTFAYFNILGGLGGGNKLII